MLIFQNHFQMHAEFAALNETRAGLPGPLRISIPVSFSIRQRSMNRLVPITLVIVFVNIFHQNRKCSYGSSERSVEL